MFNNIEDITFMDWTGAFENGKQYSQQKMDSNQTKLFLQCISVDMTKSRFWSMI